ncbi:hypothetical protein NQ314_016208 [Rhamnusium bicolor]|uniref:Oxidoreductase FAD/NAD(P)-binding domain-containing protein n=1 Tax=Rhamnusium bicolor TaxID=1586634 RepID=A0AAV8WWG3_9CUCU|nr:hypothetical protein NQ314_016208 [Rhamnusium bicolor]
MVNNEDCYTFLKLFFCCRDCNNIYLRDELYELCLNWNFTCEIFLTNSEDVSEKYNETIHKKKLEINDIQTYLLDKHKTVNVLICGSETFTENIKQYVIQCKVKEENVFSF